MPQAPDMETGALPLAGARVLIARPREQAQTMAEQLMRLGAQCELLPAIEICPLPASPALTTPMMNIDQFQRVIVVSLHAADIGLDWLDRYWPQWPVGIDWYAIGQKTAKRLASAGIEARVAPSGIDSEALLARPELQAPLQGKSLIWRGTDGRETLRTTLIERGSPTTYAELYERRLPRYDNDQIARAIREFNPHLIVALSGETLHNLLRLGHNSGVALTHHSVLVPGARVVEQALAHGFTKAFYPKTMDEEAITQAIVDYYQRQVFAS